MPITDESAPVVGHPLLGIEIEGIGTVRSVWNKADIIRAARFHAVFKRTALVRSRSFADLRGVYITPEDASTFGKQSPAELVSKPHRLDNINLVRLRNSVWKALSPRGMRTGKSKFTYRRRARHARHRWAVHRPSAIGGSLQTTLGIGVHRLLSSNARERKLCIKTLVGGSRKQAIVIAIAEAAVIAQGALFKSGGALWHHRAMPPLQVEGLRLVLFLAFINFVLTETTRMGSGGSGWAKDALGANFKGYSSFIGCGVGSNDDIMRRGVALTAYSDADLIDAIRQGRGNGRVTKALNDCATDDNWMLDNIGVRGLSIQTDVEQWRAIPNFTHNGHLYTVVECREKASKVNVKLREFLNATKSVVAETDKASLNQAQQFRTAVGTALGH